MCNANMHPLQYQYSKQQQRTLSVCVHTLLTLQWRRVSRMQSYLKIPRAALLQVYLSSSPYIERASSAACTAQVLISIAAVNDDAVYFISGQWCAGISSTRLHFCRLQWTPQIEVGLSLSLDSKRGVFVVRVKGGALTCDG